MRKKPTYTGPWILEEHTLQEQKRMRRELWMSKAVEVIFYVAAAGMILAGLLLAAMNPTQ